MANFCVEALEEAIMRHGKPDIVSTDQGSQFTGSEFIGVLKRRNIAISIGGKGAGTTTSSGRKRTSADCPRQPMPRSWPGR